MKLDIDVILKTAAQEFSNLGFDAMSMRNLAKKCGITAPALYYHFESKEALYTEVYSNLLDSIVKEIDAAMVPANTTEIRMQTFIHALFAHWAKSPLLILAQRDVITATVNSERALSKPHYVRMMSQVEKIFAAHFKTPLNPGTTYAFAALMFGYISLLPFDHDINQQTVEEHRQQRKKELVTMCLSLLDIRQKY